jgi:hypothetical protein
LLNTSPSLTLSSKFTAFTPTLLPSPPPNGGNYSTLYVHSTVVNDFLNYYTNSYQFTLSNYFMIHIMFKLLISTNTNLDEK